MAFEKVAYLAEDLHKSLYLVLDLSYLGKFSVSLLVFNERMD
jgi:hypothetical protein